ncbi:NAD(P)H-dependent glycerol-3-phosphate dehydrogenase [Litorihabitans aurantiacus]|uniref:Glycerol-3-phosphate dehydrogenase [NAD(P)+] n=1 Tax=Litorihabitans aurantiacus TaxID=1930061 RepID=A0AA37UMS7_9MICO|nr:NAD(P)H-dependent glycerol-3-phosphate dehydrogenase [Litorihabitans aurantiacus]GMA30829.1 glycerol-3-phosphate dehydrogenase [NAD(P)+] [Litorihabitans aurantiacus]
MRCAVLGSGSWGTTFAQVLADAGHDVVIWAKSAATAEAITQRHVNTTYLPGVELPDTVRADTDLTAVLEGAELVVVALPSQVVREVLAPYRAAVPRGAVVVSLMKGVELGSDERMSQVLAGVWDLPRDRVAVVSGPNLAGEIAQRQPTTTVVACEDEAVALRVAQACATPYFRTFTSTDVIGVEIGGAVKNVIALAVGIAQGLGYGDNTMASIMTRGLSEAARLGAAVGAQPATFAGLAGMGDLIATCSSPLSRNHRLGSLLGRGESLEAAIEEIGSTAEGAKSCRSILDLAQQHGVTTSIISAVVGIVHEGRTVPETVASLVDRPPRPED